MTELTEPESLKEFFGKMKGRYILLGGVLLILGIPASLGLSIFPLLFGVIGRLSGAVASYTGLVLLLFGLLAQRDPGKPGLDPH